MSGVCALPEVRPVMRKERCPVAPDEIVAFRPAQRPATTWLLMSHLPLSALPTAVPCARVHARAVALEWGLPALADDIELIVSELVTNAIRAAGVSRGDGLTTGVVRLRLFSDLRCVLIHVWDSNSLMPVRRDAALDEESGRGLMLVEHLCIEWGAYQKADGKVVWVLLG